MYVHNPFLAQLQSIYITFKNETQFILLSCTKFRHRNRCFTQIVENEIDSDFSRVRI